jgi:hypothetical protein
MNNNNTTIMFGVLFSSMILLTTTILQQQNAHASPIITNLGTTVQAHTDNGFDNGYAKGKFDITHGPPLNDTCLPKGLACDQFQSGYVTAVNQYAYHCKLCVPNNMTLLKVNETGSTPSGMVHTANGYTDGYNKGRSSTLTSI